MDKKSNTNLVNRRIYPQILAWLKEKEIIAVNGFCQSGKTTMLLSLQKQLKSNRQKTILINFEDTSQMEAFINFPQDFIALKLDQA